MKSVKKIIFTLNNFVCRLRVKWNYQNKKSKNVFNKPLCIDQIWFGDFDRNQDLKHGAHLFRKLYFIAIYLKG